MDEWRDELMNGWWVGGLMENHFLCSNKVGGSESDTADGLRV